MDDGRTLDQRRCGKTWKRPAVECGESVHFRPDGENRAMRSGDQRMLRGVNVGHHERSGAAIFLAQDGVERRTGIAGIVGARKMGSRIQCHMYRSSMAAETRTAESGETCRAFWQRQIKVSHR